MRARVVSGPSASSWSSSSSTFRSVPISTSLGRSAGSAGSGRKQPTLAPPPRPAARRHGTRGPAPARAGTGSRVPRCTTAGRVRFPPARSSVRARNGKRPKTSRAIASSLRSSKTSTGSSRFISTLSSRTTSVAVLRPGRESRAVSYAGHRAVDQRDELASPPGSRPAPGRTAGRTAPVPLLPVAPLVHAERQADPRLPGHVHLLLDLDLLDPREFLCRGGAVAEATCGRRAPAISPPGAGAVAPGAAVGRAPRARVLASAMCQKRVPSP